jgi:hypothetical protein
MPDFTLDKSYLHMEHSIEPPLRHAITIPVKPEMEGIAIYVAASPFNAGSGEEAQKRIIRQIARRLTLTE